MQKDKKLFKFLSKFFQHILVPKNGLCAELHILRFHNSWLGRAIILILFFFFSLCLVSVILLLNIMAHNHFWFLEFKIVSQSSKNHFSPFVCSEISLSELRALSIWAESWSQARWHFVIRKHPCYLLSYQAIIEINKF